MDVVVYVGDDVILDDVDVDFFVFFYDDRTRADNSLLYCPKCVFLHFYV